jgi:hypothetical protein
VEAFCRGSDPVQERAHTWDSICLQVADQITDLNVRCKAVIGIDFDFVFNGNLNRKIK